MYVTTYALRKCSAGEGICDHHLPSIDLFNKHLLSVQYVQGIGLKGLEITPSQFIPFLGAR